MKNSRSLSPSGRSRPLSPMLSTNTPCGRFRPAPSLPRATGPFRSCRATLTRAVIVCRGRIVNSIGSPGTSRTTPRSAPGRISTVTFGAAARRMSPSVPRSRTTSRPATVAEARTVTFLSAASSEAAASAAARSTPSACRCPASISIGPWNVKPGGSPSTSMRIGPSKPSLRFAVNVSSRPLPGLTWGSRPPSVTSKDGCGGRIRSV